jgi:hypothetical protein
MLSNIFDVTDPIVIDNGIQRYEYHAYEPEPGTNLNTQARSECMSRVRTQLFIRQGAIYWLKAD